MLSKSSLDVLGIQIDSTNPLALNLSQSWLVGGVLGGRVGYRWVYLQLEVAAYQAIYNPSLWGIVARLSGLVLYPSVALVGAF